MCQPNPLAMGYFLLTEQYGASVSILISTLGKPSPVMVRVTLKTSMLDRDENESLMHQPGSFRFEADPPFHQIVVLSCSIDSRTWKDDGVGHINCGIGFVRVSQNTAWVI
jgi:hypothetical protein